MGRFVVLTRDEESHAPTRRAQVSELVGRDASDLAYRGTYWLRVAYFSVFPAVPVFAFAASIVHQPGLWVGVLAAFMLGLPCLFRGGRIQAQAGRSASAFLSRQYGYPIRVKSGGIRLGVWRKEIDKAMKSGQRPTGQ